MRRLLLAALISVGAGCGGGGGDDEAGACGAEEQLPGTSIDDIGKLASISVQERQSQGSPIERFANAIFMDFSSYDADAPPTVGLGPVCSTVTGDVVVRSDATVLDSPAAAVVTIAGEQTTLEEVARGRLQSSEVAELDAGGDVQVRVDGGGGATEFPSFEATVQASGAPADMAGEMSPNGELILRWAQADAEAIEIELWVQDPEMIADFHPVRCVVADDGCLTVPSEAVAFYLGSPPFDVRMSAVRSVQWDGADGEIGYLKVERRRDFAVAP